MHNKSKIDKFEKTIEYTTYLMILMFYTGKVFEVLVGIIDISFLILLFLKKDIEFIKRYKKLIVLFSVFILYLAIQSLFANHIKVALGNSLGLIRFIILTFALFYIFNDSIKIKKLLYSIFAIIGLLFLDASYQYLVGHDIFGYPLYQHIRLTCWSNMPKLSEFISIFMGIVLSSFLLFKDNKDKKLSLIILIILSIMIIMAGNRGPVMYLLSSLIITLFFSKHYRKYVLYIIGGSILVFTIVFSLNDTLYKQFSVYKHPLDSHSNTGRTPIYKVSLSMLKDHPLIGIGSKNFRYDFKDYHVKIYNQQKEHDIYDEKYLKSSPLHTHSILLSYLLNWGLIGSMIFLYIMIYIYKKYIISNKIALLTSVSLLYCLTPLNFGKSIAQGQWQFFIFLSLAFVMIVSNYTKNSENGLK